jgi:hypothetical protein
MVIQLDVGVKGVEQISESAFEHQRPLGGTSVHDCQVVCLCELFDGVEIGGFGSVLVRQILVGQVSPLRQGLTGQFIGLRCQLFGVPARAKAYGNARCLIWVHRARRLRGWQQRLLASSYR